MVELYRVRTDMSVFVSGECLVGVCGGSGGYFVMFCLFLW